MESRSSYQPLPQCLAQLGTLMVQVCPQELPLLGSLQGQALQAEGGQRGKAGGQTWLPWHSCKSEGKVLPPLCLWVLSLVNEGLVSGQ